MVFQTQDGRQAIKDGDLSEIRDKHESDVGPHYCVGVVSRLQLREEEGNPDRAPWSPGIEDTDMGIQKGQDS